MVLELGKPAKVTNGVVERTLFIQCQFSFDERHPSCHKSGNSPAIVHFFVLWFCTDDTTIQR